MRITYRRERLDLIFLILFFIADYVSANEWIKESSMPGDWGNPSNWSIEIPSYNGNAAVINNGGTAIIDGIDASTSGVTLGFYIGEWGYINQHGGTLQVRTDIKIGGWGGGGGKFLLDENGELYVNGNEILGDGGTGHFEQISGKHHVTGTLSIANTWRSAYYSGPDGSYTLRGGELQAQNEVIANKGSYYQYCNAVANFYQYDGTNTITDSLYLGKDMESVGTYYFENGNLNIAGNEQIGSDGRGIINQRGGIHLVEGDMRMGSRYHIPGYGGLWIRGEGFMNLSGGECTVLGTEYVGYNDGVGHFNQTGAKNTADTIKVGSEINLGEYFINDGELHVNVFQIGSNGTFMVEGADSIIDVTNFEMSDGAKLISNITSEGISILQITDQVILSGTWEVSDLDAGFGRFEILQTEGLITGSFERILFPDDNWQWGMDSQSLWVEHIPEPSSLILLYLGSLILKRMKC
jgi:hypothetical protein